MNRFFVARPVFAWVIALFIVLFGTIALTLLPVEQYPDVAPPSLSITAAFSGADASTLERTVTSIVEDEMNGIENFLYMSSVSRSNGTMQITVVLKPGTDLDIARTQVQDRLSRVEPRLPLEVRQVGVRVTKASSGFLMLLALQATDGTTSAVAMGNFASNNIVNELRRIDGVGDVQLFGSSYAMRIWLDPRKLAGFGLSASEVLQAIQEQNSQTAGGGLGDQPIAPGSEFTAQIVTQSRFTTPEQFREIIVHANPDGSTVRVGDVARVELGNDSYGNRLTVNGKASAGIAIQLASGANALAVANAVRQRMAELQPIFPRGVAWTVPFDTTPFITTSVQGVIRTMVEALLLVTVVVFLFLQDWRATVIPTIVVPIALIGTCAGLYLFGLSINILSLFGMVVAIGILNDDAIVVVENVARIMREEGLGAPRATVKAIGQISGAAIASTLVLVAVFIPMAFFPGSTGGIYRQFSVTLAVSILLSTLLALTLGAALCAALLRSEAAARERPKNPASRMLHRVFDGFNRGLDAGTTRYIGGVDAMLRSPLRWLLVFVAACAITVFFFTRLPTGFLPTEDQGHIFITYTGPPGSTDQRTQRAIDQVEAFLRTQPQVRNVASVTGFSFFGQGQSAALSFVDLEPWDERSGEANSASALVRRANAAFRQIPEAIIFALDPPAIPSLGNATGFTMKIQDRSGIGGEPLQEAARRMMIEASQSPLLAGVRAEGMPEAPQLYVEIDRVKARALGLQIGQVNQALALTFGANYVNDFVFEGNVLRVLLQADAEQRMRAEDVTSLRLRNNRGEMVPFSAFTRVRWISGPQQLERYNGFPSATLSGQAAPGRSSGAAIAEMERIASHVLTGNLSYEWTGTALEEKQASGQIGMLLGLSLVVVFLLLAALYESWAIPVAVLLIIPFGVIGAVLLTMLRGLSADVYFNIGLVTIIGLAAKNAILIVEFAIKEESEGRDALAAAKSGAQQRLRPILMTSVTFVLGMLPLVLATGAGAASRRAVGTGVMGSMLTATLFGIFFTPLFYVAARRWLSRNKRSIDLDDDDLPTAMPRDSGGGQRDA
ncbi:MULTISPECIES: multidrug efflux RND transporter permease subunit [unclassified Paraburkholderia]|uniref:multidrug efflux RND transporter permease subunit n=1 Tax=unclassified Paraburkholderia TaxID=2615204 RepID=UPI001615F89E|nr:MULTISPECIES: multidrug efflux RND transporter permease subunit [unclassified Paraburkholderia]MBB5446674.1 multidrug efflux pump [Paraburkholderia sp. WSM4177]MBB5487219.1 multidrug efflux pump [Paraburkholderia sp. WSM4180]